MNYDRVVINRHENPSWHFSGESESAVSSFPKSRRYAPSMKDLWQICQKLWQNLPWIIWQWLRIGIFAPHNAVFVAAMHQKAVKYPQIFFFVVDWQTSFRFVSRWHPNKHDPYMHVTQAQVREKEKGQNHGQAGVQMQMRVPPWPIGPDRAHLDAPRPSLSKI